MPFEEVDYWEELETILDWSRTHVYSTLHVCWGAQAGLYHRYGIPKYPLPAKQFGVFLHHINRQTSSCCAASMTCFMFRIPAIPRSAG